MLNSLFMGSAQKEKFVAGEDGLAKAKKTEIVEAAEEVWTCGRALTAKKEGSKARHSKTSNSHFTERGCVRSISRSAWIRRTAWYRAVVLRLVGTTQPRSGLK
jgi:hypothetical protein